MESGHLSSHRNDYVLGELNEKDLPFEPFELLEHWLAHARKEVGKDYNAMVLSTVQDGKPSSRVVLLRGIKNGALRFFTNYNSAKGKSIDQNEEVCLNFFWSALERQIRLSGKARKVMRTESEVYFASRPRESQVGAWASEQSEVIEGREALEKSIVETQERFHGQEIPCPPDWGGYDVQIEHVEFWQGRSGRTHDRICYSLEHENWVLSRLQP